MWRSQLSQVALRSVSCSKIEALLTSTVSGRPSASAAAGTSAAVAVRSSRSAATTAARRAGGADLVGQRLGRGAAGVAVDRHGRAARREPPHHRRAEALRAAGDERGLDGHAARKRQSGRPQGSGRGPKT